LFLKSIKNNKKKIDFILVYIESKIKSIKNSLNIFNFLPLFGSLKLKNTNEYT